MELRPTWASLAMHVHGDADLDVQVAHVDCVASVELYVGYCACL